MNHLNKDIDRGDINSNLKRNDLIKEINKDVNTDHYPVLLSEVIENLALQNNKKYLDCTFGCGGYSKAILTNKNCFVTAIDQDPNILIYADN